MEPQELAQQGLRQLKEAIVLLLAANPEGLRNFEIASALDIRSDHNGRQKDYLSFSILGLLMKSGEVAKTRNRRYKLSKP
jgi:uncharacterized protein